jgi:hypothetical protein
MTSLNRIASASPSRLLLVTLALAVLAIAVAGALSASAKASQFEASKPILKRMCDRYDADFWSQGRRYGCGEQVLCTQGQCRTQHLIFLYREPGSRADPPGIAGIGGDRARD